MELTPAMRQYLDLKEQNKDCILFFRMGDFYEMFFEDAVRAAKILDITLTSRNKGKEDSIPLCGVPYHAAGTYIAKLIEHGCKVAICEQMEDPRQAKGVVKREVVRIVTPGLVVDPDNLEEKENNFLGALSYDETSGQYGLAFLDISTGEFQVTETQDRAFFLSQVAGLDFREVIVPMDFRDKGILKTLGGGEGLCRINELPPQEKGDFTSASCILAAFFLPVQIEESAILQHPAAALAAGAIIRYAGETQKERLTHINAIRWYREDDHLLLDEDVKKNLELFSTIAGGKSKGSLFHVLDETVTAMGGRRLRWWLCYPLIDPERIRERLEAVSEIKDLHLVRDNLRRVSEKVYDLERIGGRIAMGVANGRDLVALKASLATLPEIVSFIDVLESHLIRSIRQGIDVMADLHDLIERSIADDPPLTLREGNLIREGYDRELDGLISLCRDGKQWIAALEEKERKRTGINSLRVGFNTVFGYYIEITRANANLVPGDYIRKQTLLNAERYINEELKDYETQVLSAEEKRREREYDLFIGIREEIAKSIKRIQKTASLIADLDALQSLAEVAERYNYCCPSVDGEDRIEICEGRHPVVERMSLPDGFVPNDVFMDSEENRFLIITGPNMAGKSTYIRQVALTVLLAQMGSFVPAARAHIGVVDRIFTRIGAMDNLTRGQSTFMVEMNDVAHILQNAKNRSLIILDEVGRGTSTFDGLSIAWAIAEYIHDTPQLRARTLFATHYHQLTELAATRTGVKNYNIAVKEWGDRIIFLRKIMEGATNRSYGIEVARIAGLPEEVIVRAKEVLHNCEKGEFDEVGMPKIARGRKSTPTKKAQLSLFLNDEDLIIQELRNLDVMNTKPLDALNKISAWRDRLAKA